MDRIHLVSLMVAALTAVHTASASESPRSQMINVDAAALLQQALSAAYTKYSDLNEDELSLRYPSVSIDCEPGSNWVVPSESDGNTWRKPLEVPNCSAGFEFVVKPSVEQEVTNNSDGSCEFNEKFERVMATVYSDGTTVLRRGESRQSSAGDCSETDLLIDPQLVIREYEAYESKRATANDNPSEPGISQIEKGEQ